MKKIVIILIAATCFIQAQAQDKWSLQKCIDYALENNIVIKQHQINTEYQENQLQQSKNNRLPNLNGSIGQNFSFGRVKTDTDTYGSGSFRSSSTSFGLSTGATLYAGSTLQNTIKQRDYDFKSSLENLQKAKDDLKLNLASGYLDILFAKELVAASAVQIEQTNQQIERTRQLVDAGKVARGTLLEIEAQLAREELDMVNRKNSLQITYLNLAQLLELEDYRGFEIVVPEFPELKAQVAVAIASEVYNKAVEMRPEIKSAEYTLQSSEVALKIAEGYLLPSLSASAGISDGYYNSNMGDFPSFGDQIRDKHSEYIGLNLSIPVFNRFSNKTNIANSKLQIMNNELELEAAKKELRKQIETAYINATAALKRYNANKVAVSSMEETFRYVEEKYNVGMVTSVEYNDAKTKLAIAESDLIQAKYEFIFRSKILDFYNGQPIEL